MSDYNKVVTVIFNDHNLELNVLEFSDKCILWEVNDIELEHNKILDNILHSLWVLTIESLIVDKCCDE